MLQGFKPLLGRPKEDGDVLFPAKVRRHDSPASRDQRCHCHCLPHPPPISHGLLCGTLSSKALSACPVHPLTAPPSLPLPAPLL